MIYAGSLTEATGGNAIGVGLAGLLHRRLIDGIDPRSTAVNAMTGGSPQTAAVPVTAETDRDAMKLFSRFLNGASNTDELRCVRLEDTLSLDPVLVSTAVARVSPAGVSAAELSLGLDPDGDFLPVEGYDG